MKSDLITKIALIAALIMGIIVIIQLWRAIFGGTWPLEGIVIALLVLNLTMTFNLVNKISKIDKKVHGHMEWHRGTDRRKY